MKSQHRSILAIALSVGVIILWYAFLSPTKRAPVEKGPAAMKEMAGDVARETPPPERETVAAPAAPSAEAEEPATTDPQAGLAEVTTTIEGDNLRIVFTNKGGVPATWELKGYRETADEDSPPIDLAPQAKGGSPSLALAFEDANFSFPAEPTYRLVSAEKNNIVYEWQSDEVAVTKSITIDPTTYTADVSVAVRNRTRRTLTGTPTLIMGGTSAPTKRSGFFSFLRPPPSTNASPVYYLDGKVRREKKINKLPTAQVVASEPAGGGLYWAGLEDRYFLSAVIPRTVSSGVKAVLGASPMPAQDKGALALFAGAALAPTSIVPGGSAEMTFSAYMGPKEIGDLKAIGVHLEDAIDYGWFTIIALPILYLLKMFYTVVRNYGVAIILLTIFIKLLLHPINVKSLKSMKAMQQLQPKLKELQKKYKGDKEKLNVETMQLFRAHKVNPMGGCLPMILQFPIYIALYKVLWNSIELYHAPFFWFYRDLSAPDPYMITPILLGVFMVAQQKLMPSATADPAQQKMMMIMPIMFTVFMIFLPVGLVVYILINTVMSVVTQWMYNKGIRMRDVLRFKFKTARLA